MKNRVNNSLFNKQLVNASFVESFRKLDPRVMIKNPIMFTVEVVTFVMLLLIVWIAVTGNTSQGSLGYNIVIFLVLLATVLFANFAEAIAAAGRRPTRCAGPVRRLLPNVSRRMDNRTSSAARRCARVTYSNASRATPSLPTVR